jgi:phage terminase large subunit-like protein
MKETILVPKLNDLKAERCRQEFFYFLQEFWDVIIPETPVYNWHIPYLCNEVQKVVEKVIKREAKDYDLIINISPGETKSTIITVMLPVWAWIKDPSIRSLTASYSASLSTDHSVKSRDIIRSDKFKSYFPEIVLKTDQDGKTHYKNTLGGERYATSVTGSITGFHAHLLIVDDPLNPKEAASEVERKRANDFMDITLSTRKVNKSVTPTILVMQRLHQDDCTGNWLTKDKTIKHICLPGEISKDIKPIELREKYTDGLMNATRLTRNDLAELKTNLGSYGYSGQIMQTPTPLDGGIWQRWIIAVPDSEFPKELTKIGSDWDLAYTEKETNSACAYVTAGLFNSKMYIDDIGWDWMEFPALINYMKIKKSPHYIEAKASGKSAKQTLSNQGIPAIEVKVDGGDKIARAMLSTPFAEAGMIYCRQSIIEKLYNDDRQGILIFPNTGTDLADALAQSIYRLLNQPQMFFF